MAQERLTLIDDMSPALRRIAQECERAYASLNKLKNTSASLMVPGSISRAISDVQRLEKEFARTQQSISQKARQIVQAGHSSVAIDKQGRYTVNGIPVHPANVPVLEQRLVQNWERSQQISAWRRNQSFMDRARGLGYGVTPKLDKLAQVYSNIHRSGESVSSSFLRLVAVLGSAEFIFRNVVALANQLIKPQDAYVGALTRTALVSDKSMAPEKRLDELYQVAERTRADATGTMSLYNRIAMSGMRASNDRIMRFVETFNKTMAISGTSAQENRAVMLQLAQGMGSNRLGGDEFRSIAEQAPMFKYMLAKGLNVNPGELKKMGAEGKLTAEAIMSAMEKVQDQIDDIFKDAPWTIGQGLIVMQTEWQRAVTKNMAGYVALRDLIMDIIAWLRRPEGQLFMNNIINAINRCIIAFTQWFRQMVPLFKWVANHLHLLGQLVKLFITAWGFSSLFGNLLTMRSSILAVAEAGKFMGVTVSSAVSSIALTVNTALVGILGMIGAIVLAYQLGQKIANWKQEYDDRHAMDWDYGMQFKMRDEDVAKKMKEWQKQHPNAKPYEYSRVKMQYEKDWDSTVGAKARENYEKNVKQPYLDSLSSEQAQLEALQNKYGNIEGMMDSSKNKPMDVNNVKNVDHINDDINLSTESIQMMKAIAERQWVVQNEITVPQNVNMNVDKSTNVDPESLSQALNQGMQIAIASSMRGEAFV